MKLTPRQQAFAREYLVDRNATKAAERVGYSGKTAYSQGSRLLKHVEVRALVDKGEQTAAEKAGLTVDLVYRTLVRALKFDPASTLDKHGKPLPLEKLPTEVRLALRSYNVRPSYFEGELVDERVEVEYPDKVSTAVAGGRLLGIDKSSEGKATEVHIVIGPEVAPVPAAKTKGGSK